MGAGNSAFTSKELDDYQDWTYLTKKEIITAFNRFMALAELEDDKAKIRAKEGKKNHYLDAKWMDKFPELQVNPFKTRILEVFSSVQNNSASAHDPGSMTFEDFLDMMSVFSDSAPKNLKADFAFQIYDFNNDGYICENDLRKVVKKLTNNDKAKEEGATNILEENQIDTLLQNVFDEADLDGDRKLSYAEFEHVLSKAPDFVTSFRIRF